MNYSDGYYIQLDITLGVYFTGASPVNGSREGMCMQNDRSPDKVMCVFAKFDSESLVDVNGG